MAHQALWWIWLGTVWSANIYDLMVGNYFYSTTIQIVITNILGIVSLALIVMDLKNKKVVKE